MIIFWFSMLIGIFAFLITKYVYRKSVQIPKLTDWWLFVVALALQHIFIATETLNVFQLKTGTIAMAYFVANFITLLFLIINIKNRAILIFTLGALLNIIAITVNSGFMPVSSNYAAIIYGQNLAVEGQHILNTKSIVLDNPQLWFLTDILYLFIPYYQNIAFSIGDIIMCVGYLLYFAGDESVKKL